MILRELLMMYLSDLNLEEIAGGTKKFVTKLLNDSDIGAINF